MSLDHNPARGRRSSARPGGVRGTLLESVRVRPPPGESEQAVRFEIRYPTGQTHEVELQGSVVILGRDPSCDLVINDVKCSRRHAVVEAGPDGLVVRDSGSANGVYVNGRKIDRMALKERDEVKLGDVTLVVLPDEVTGTVVMAPDEYGQIPVGPATAEMPVIDPDGTIMPGPNAIP